MRRALTAILLMTLGSHAGAESGSGERGATPRPFRPHLSTPEPPESLPKLSEEPREVLTKKLRKAIEDKDLTKQADLQYQLGRLIKEKWSGQDYERGVSYLNAAARTYEKLKSPEQSGGALMQLGMMYLEHGDTSDAIANFEKALKLFGIGEASPSQAWAASWLGTACFKAGRYDDAVKYYQQSLKTLEALGDDGSVSKILDNVGGVLAARGNAKEAVDYFKRSLAIKEKLGDKPGAARCLNNLGNAFAGQERYDEAHEYYTRTIKAYEALGDRKLLAETQGNLANVYGSTRRFAKALEWFQRSLKVFEELGDKRNAIITRMNLANVYYNLADHRRSLTEYGQCLSEFEKLGDAAGMAMTLKNMGGPHRMSGQPIEALKCWARSLEIYKRIGDKKTAAHTVANMATLNRELRDFAKAVLHLKEAINLYQAIGEERQAIGQTFILAQTQEQAGDSKSALATWESLNKKLPGNAAVLNGLAWFLVTTEGKELRDPKRALPLATKANEIAEGRSPAILDTLAEVYHANGKFKEAVETEMKAEVLAPGHFTQSLERFRKALELGKKVPRVGDAPAPEGDAEKKKP